MPYVSPGVYSSEIDSSLFAQTATNTTFGVVGSFNKGAIDTVLSVTSIDDLVNQVGSPIDPATSTAAPQGWYAAREYLRKGNQCKVVRVESSATPAIDALISLPAGSDDYVVTDTDGVTSVPAVRTLTSAGGAFVVDGVKAGDILEVHEGGADDGFYVLAVVAATVLTIDRDWPTGSLASQDFTVWSSKEEAGVDGATGTSSSRTFTSAGSTFTTNGVAAGDILSIEDTGTAGDNGVYVIASVDSNTQLTLTRDFPAGSLSSLTFTVYGPSSSGSDGDCTADGTFTSATAKFADKGVKAGDLLYIRDAVTTDNNGYYTIVGTITDTSFSVVSGISGGKGTRAWASSVAALDYEIWPASMELDILTPGTYHQGQIVKVVRNSGDTTNCNIEVYDSTGAFLQERIFDVDLSNLTTADDVSQIFEGTVITNRTEPASGTWSIATATPARPVLSFGGGDDGITSIADADFMGSASDESGLYALINPEKYDCDLIAIPGRSSQIIGDALISFAETRGDCLALIDPPDDPTVDSIQDILDFSNGTLTRTTALNSSYAALYWTWGEVYDEFNDSDVWAAPSGHAAAIITQSDNLSAPWFAPAGFKRGKSPGIQDLRISPDQGQRDSLQNGTQVVNPFINFVGSGIHLYGQKTCYRSTSALNRVNVRRMLNYLRKVISKANRQLVFDPNDDVLFREFQQLTAPTLQYVLANRGLSDWKLVNATTAQDLENSTFRGGIYVKPVKSAEVIILQFTVTNQNTNFEELLVASS